MMTTFLDVKQQEKFMSYKLAHIDSKELRDFLDNVSLDIRELNPDEYNGNKYGIMLSNGKAIFFNYPLTTRQTIDFIKKSDLFFISKPTEAEVIHAIRNSTIYYDRIPINRLENINVTIQEQDWSEYNIFNNHFLFNGQARINIKGDNNEIENLSFIVNFHSKRG